MDQVKPYVRWLGSRNRIHEIYKVCQWLPNSKKSGYDKGVNLPIMARNGTNGKIYRRIKSDQNHSRLFNQRIKEIQFDDIIIKTSSVSPPGQRTQKTNGDTVIYMPNNSNETNNFHLEVIKCAPILDIFLLLEPISLWITEIMDLFIQ